MTDRKTCKQDGTELCADPENNSPNGVCVLNKCPQVNRPKRNEITIYNIKTSKLIPGSDGAWDVNTTVVVISNLEEEEFLANIGDQLSDQDDSYRVELTKVAYIPEDLIEKTMKALKPWVENVEEEKTEAHQAPEISDEHVNAVRELLDRAANTRALLIEFQDDGEVAVIPKALLDDISWSHRSRDYKLIADRNDLYESNTISDDTTANDAEIVAQFLESEYTFTHRIFKPDFLDRYELRDDGGSTKVIDASPDEIEAEAEEWAKDGDWGDGGCIVRVHFERLFRCPYHDCGEEFLWGDAVRMRECPHCDEELLIPADDELHEGDISVEIPQDPYSIDANLKDLERDGHEHKWESPYDIVGGLKENPGVFGGSGLQIKTHQVCVCGAHQHTDSDSQRYQQRQGIEDIVSVEYPDDLWPWGRGATFPGEVTADCDLCGCNFPADQGANVEGTILSDGETGWFCESCIADRMDEIHELYGEKDQTADPEPPTYEGYAKDQ